MAEMQFQSLEEALDHAARILVERFGEVDQRAAVELAQVLYVTQERDRFLHRQDQTAEPPYRA